MRRSEPRDQSWASAVPQTITAFPACQESNTVTSNCRVSFLERLDSRKPAHKNTQIHTHACTKQLETSVRDRGFNRLRSSISKNRGLCEMALLGWDQTIGWKSQLSKRSRTGIKTQSWECMTHRGRGAAKKPHFYWLSDISCTFIAEFML